MSSVDWRMVTLNTNKGTKFKGVKGLKDELDDDEINVKGIDNFFFEKKKFAKGFAIKEMDRVLDEKIWKRDKNARANIV